MRLIDAEALGIGVANETIFKEREYAHGWNSAIKIIDNAPTIDAVPVVRCKDCQHMEKSQYGRYCQIWRMYNGHGDDGFCCYGERKEGAD